MVVVILFSLLHLEDKQVWISVINLVHYRIILTIWYVIYSICSNVLVFLYKEDTICCQTALPWLKFIISINNFMFSFSFICYPSCSFFHIADCRLWRIFTRIWLLYNVWILQDIQTGQPFLITFLILLRRSVFLLQLHICTVVFFKKMYFLGHSCYTR